MDAAGGPRLVRRESGEADSLALFRFCPGVVAASESSGCGMLTDAAIASCGVVNPAGQIVSRNIYLTNTTQSCKIQPV
jgi:hypothetical protein